MKNSFLIKGDIVFSLDSKTLDTYENGTIVCVDGRVKMVLKENESVPEEYADLPFIDYSNYLIIPGMIDLHVHAPQYTFRGIGMNKELLEWLNTYTFPEEARYKDTMYARTSYSYFVEDLRRSFTTRAAVFATIHNNSTRVLMDILEDSGVITYVGRVNMDRNGSDNLQEESAEASLKGTLEWLKETEKREYQRTFPILTPRFIPSCSNELMLGLSELSKKMNLRIQSHLDENLSEIAWVNELVPEAKNYGRAYELFGQMGTEDTPTIMAHCVYLSEDEFEMMKEHGAYVAHCPDSNLNLTSGIAPIRKMMEKGLKVGLGTDVAGGSSLNMVKTMLCALQSSKMYYRLVDQSKEPLSFEEVFYLATMAGGEFFGKVGTFKIGYEFDAVIIDDTKMRSVREMTVHERAERMIYNDTDCIIRDKYVRGERVFENRD